MMPKINISVIKSFIKIVKINADSPPSILDGSGEFPSGRDAEFLVSEWPALLGKGPGLLQAQPDPEGKASVHGSDASEMTCFRFY